jgi:hypothetical protein
VLGLLASTVFQVNRYDLEPHSGSFRNHKGCDNLGLLFAFALCLLETVDPGQSLCHIGVGDVVVDEVDIVPVRVPASLFRVLLWPPCAVPSRPGFQQYLSESGLDIHQDCIVLDIGEFLKVLACPYSPQVHCGLLMFQQPWPCLWGVRGTH